MFSHFLVQIMSSEMIPENDEEYDIVHSKIEALLKSGGKTEKVTEKEVDVFLKKFDSTYGGMSEKEAYCKCVTKELNEGCDDLLYK